MATHRLPVLGSLSMPDTSGELYLGPLTVHATTNSRWPHLVWVFQDSSTKDGVSGVFEVPQNYASAANLVVVWTTAATTGDVLWDFEYRAVGGNDTESFDQTGQDQQINSTDTAPSAAFERLEVSLSLTDGNFAAGDTVQYTFFRDGSGTSDTLADEALVFGLDFEYDD